MRNFRRHLRSNNFPAGLAFTDLIGVIDAWKFRGDVCEKQIGLGLEGGMMSSVRQHSMTDMIYFETRFQILSGSYLPGSQLDRNKVSELYGCSPGVVLDAFNTLHVEGYLDLPKRGAFSVRAWDANELEDYYDLWVTLSGTAAARAAERADDHHLLALADSLSRAKDFDFLSPQSTERYLVEYVHFTAQLIKVSRAAPLMNISHFILPNFLFRRAIWSSSASQLKSERRALDEVVQNLVRRSPAFAKDGLRKIIMNTMPAVRADLLKSKVSDEVAVIKRAATPLKKNGVVFDLGGREPALDGLIVPYGISPNR
jgi:DNA-binding GntR family transcriptional regulator